VVDLRVSDQVGIAKAACVGWTCGVGDLTVCSADRDAGRTV
jgi:hypothetical protein